MGTNQTENKDIEKMSKIAIIAAVVLGVVLIVSIVLAILPKQKDNELSKESESEEISTEVLLSETEEIEIIETELPEANEVETEEKPVSDNTEDNSTTPDSTNNNTGSTNQDNTGNSNTGNNTGNTGGNTNNGSGNVSDIAPNVGKYDPADTNKDGWVDANEEMSYITPQKQKCIDAGYGVVVEQDGGEWYAVLTKNGDQLFDGKMGDELLREYLKERGLHARLIKGCWINSDNEWYWYVAEDIEKIPESTDGNGEINWDEIEWEDSYP